MTFSQKQISALRRQPDARYVRTREVNGRQLSYLEGWYAISEANRIFGFDGWSRETIESRCVLSRETRGVFLAVYTAKVRITVKADGLVIVREGHGTGESRANTPGEVHDTALKAAETDATKRAFATFGRPFGLELYKAGRPPKRSDSGQQNVPNVTSHVQVVACAVQSNGRRREDAQASASPTTLLPESRQAPLAVSRDAEPSATAHPMRSNHEPVLQPSRHYDRQRCRDVREYDVAMPRDVKHKDTEVSLAPSAPAPLGSPGIDKSVLTFGEPKRVRDKAHLKFVAAQPCLICGRQPSDAHHLRFAQPRALGRKVSDEFTVPLCRGHHRELHQMGNEPTWWDDLDIDALEIAKGLWEQSRLGLERPSETAIAVKENLPEADR